MRILNNLDLARNQVLNFRAQNLAGAPSTPTAGMLYYDTGLTALYIYNGTSWIPADATKSTGIPNTALATNPLSRANHTGTQAWSTLTSTPTTLSGYGITDAATSASPTFTGTVTIPTVTAGDSSTKAASTAFVSTAIADLINGAPGALDTLKELSDALGADANFSTTITNALALKAPLANPVLTGTPTAPTASANTNNTQIATTAYVDAAVIAGGTGTVQKYAINIGDTAATVFVITHNLNSRDVNVSIRQVASPYAFVHADVEATTVNSVTVTTAVAPDTAEFRVIVLA